MGLETGTYISDLVATNPVSNDPKSQGDDHLRFIKSAILATWPNVTGAVTATQAELNILDGATLSTAELNILDGVTASTAELNILDGATLTVTELNYVDGVTSAIQTQMDLKAPLASPALTGTPTAPTASFGASGTQVATLDFVNAVSFSAVLPSQTGNAGKILNTDGSTASWGTTLNVAVVSPSTGTAFATTTATQTLTGKTLQTPILQDSGDTTKKANVILSGITAGQNRNITLADENMTLFTPGWRLLSTVTASNSATVDVETTFNSTYDNYVIVADNITVQTNNDELYLRMKIGGSYLSTATYDTIIPEAADVTGSAQGEIINDVQSAASTVIAFHLHISNPTSTAYSKGCLVHGYHANASTLKWINRAIQNTGTGALTGIRFLCSSGNILTGTFRLYGIRNS